MTTSIREGLQRMREGSASVGPVVAGTMRSDGTKRIPLISPARYTECGSVSIGTQELLDEAVEAAAEAQRTWQALTLVDRSERLMALAAAIAAEADTLGVIDCLDTGSPVVEMVADAKKGARQMRMVAGVGPELHGRNLLATNDNWHVTRPYPCGVVGAISAFNHPALFFCQKVSAALMAGNAVVLKPDERACVTPVLLGLLAQDFLPSGLLAVVPGGRDVGEALVSHPGIPRLTFTGGATTGLRVQRTASESGHVKKLTLELGGKNALVALPDVDTDTVVAAGMKGMNFTRVTGQSCGSTSRMFVHRSKLDAVLQGLRARIDALTIGDPEDQATDVGSLISREHRDRALGLAQRALDDGAELIAGGDIPDLPDDLASGAFLEPTVLCPRSTSDEISQTEVFGPVLAVYAYDETDDAIEAANATNLGLTASLWTNDLTNGLALAERLEAGYVWVNDVERRYPGVPFGGWKNSGIGSEQGLLEDIESYCRFKSITIKSTP